MSEHEIQEIEREIAAERVALDHAMNALADRTAPDAFAARVRTAVGAGLRPLIRSVAERLDEHPAMATAATLGLDLMLSGPVQKPRPAPRAEGSVPRSAPPPQTQTNLNRKEIDMTLVSDHDIDDLHSTHAAKAYIRDVGDRVYSTAADLRARIDEGTQDLSEAARTRVRKARAAAIAAQERVEKTLSHTAQSARATAQDNPLLTGLAMFAAGAALGAALPRTETENRTFGRYRDHLFEEAERVFREETAKLRQVADATLSEGRDVLHEKLANGRSAMRDATSRIAETAGEEASRQGLGHVS